MEKYQYIFNFFDNLNNKIRIVIEFLDEITRSIKFYIVMVDGRQYYFGIIDNKMSLPKTKDDIIELIKCWRYTNKKKPSNRIKPLYNHNIEIINGRLYYNNSIYI
jgi:hypothetical protein